MPLNKLTQLKDTRGLKLPHNCNIKIYQKNTYYLLTYYIVNEYHDVMEKRYNLAILEALFKDQLSAEKCSKVTIKNYLSDLRHYHEWLYWHHSVTYQHVEVSLDEYVELMHAPLVNNYVAYLLSNDTPTATLKRRVSTLRRYYAFCYNRGILPENICSYILLPGISPKPVNISEYEVLKQDLQGELTEYELQLCMDIVSELQSM